MTDYVMKRSTNMREVITHFFRLEGQRDKYSGMKNDFYRWEELDDESFYKEVSQFRDKRNDVNPVFTWTIGSKNNRHHHRVKRWILADISIGALYTNGIKPIMKHDLREVKGNLLEFVNYGFHAKYPKFITQGYPNSDFQRTLIGVISSSSNNKGTIEIN